MMKKTTILSLILTMLLTFSACADKTGESIATPSNEAESVSEEPVELIIFAAASMTETLTQIAEMYKEVAPNVTLTLNFDSSGTLKTQIEEGAYCDIFISAAQKQMNALDVTKGTDANPNKQDFIDPETRINLLENKVVLVVPEENPANITKFSDIAKANLIALGNSDVPVGSYSLEILSYLGLDVATLESSGKITYGTNVKEVTTQVAEGTVDCGIVYATDAYSAGLTIVDIATTDMCKQVVNPVAALKSSKNADAAKAFLDYLNTDESMAVFEEVGFIAVK